MPLRRKCCAVSKPAWIISIRKHRSKLAVRPRKSRRSFDPCAGRTIFIDMYAMQAAYHMWKYGTTARQIAIACSKNHHQGAINPKAQYRFEVPVDQVLNDRMVADPLTRSMCAPIGDGAATAILCSSDYL